MGLVISKGLTLRHQLPADAEADAYIAAVEQADGQALEPGVKFAIKNFVLCCKQDGIWNAIKASCILAGARTLEGALVPLVGTAPTNVGSLFVSGDYDRKTGLVGNGSTKFLNSNRAANADPQNNAHMSTYMTQTPSSFVSQNIMGVINSNNGSLLFSGAAAASFLGIMTTGDPFISASRFQTGFYGGARSSSATYIVQTPIRTGTVSINSSIPSANDMHIFDCRSGGNRTSARLAFYSIGESLDLALLDARVTDLINAFGAAIP